jgi:hypothetical protein
MQMVQISLFIIAYVSLAVSESVRYAAELNIVPASARVAAMGDAGVALPLDAAGVFWNPASHAFIKTYEVSAEYARLYGGLSSQANCAVHAPLQEQMSACAFYDRFSSGNIEQHDSLAGASYQERIEQPSIRADGSSTGLFTNNHNLILLSIAKIFSVPIPRPASYSYPMPIELSAGISFKDYWQTMNPGGKVRMGNNVNCDAGLLLRISINYDLAKKQVDREIYVGAAVKDFLGTRVVWLHSPDDYQESIDRKQYFGISYVDGSGLLGARWIASFAMMRSYETTYHGGLEAQLWNTIAFRLGLSDRVFTCGAGLTYKRYSLDYAFRFDELEYSPLRLALRVVF